MVKVVNEPLAEYKIAGWQKGSKDIPFNDFINGIENETVLFYPPSGHAFMIFSEKPKMKLSALRGKLTKQSEKEIEDQILDLRSEWDRSI